MSVDIPQEVVKKSFQASLKLGDVFLKNFEGIDHPKFFIVAGMTESKLSVCSVFINSRINPSLFNRQVLLNAQVPLKKAGTSFLSHDSFANCSSAFVLQTESIVEEIISGQCKVIGTISTEDLQNVRRAIVDTGLLKRSHEEMFFGDLLP